MSGSRIRVLHIVQSLNYGGMERLIAGMVRNANYRRFELHVLGLSYLGHFSEGLERYAELHLGPQQVRWSLLSPRELAETIRFIAPDIVHTHSGVWLKAARAARMAGVRATLHTEHGRRAPDPLSDRLIDRYAARYSDLVVAVSGQLQTNLIREIGVPAHKVRYIANGVDTCLIETAADSQSLRMELGIPENVPILGSVGRLERIKGYEVAIHALATMRGEHSAVLVIAGDGSERSALERLARELRISDRVFLLGWRDDITRLHAAANVFTMSSHSEGTSVSLLEAMAAGLCPVVTAVGGNPAVLGDSLAHRLVPPANPGALAENWVNALRDSARRSQDGAAARARILQNFSLKRMVAEYEDLYKQLLDTSSVRPLEHAYESR